MRLVLAVMLVLTGGAAAAQQTPAALVDDRWLPWIGCWQSESERLVSDSARLCVTPDADTNSVKVQVIIDDTVASTQMLKPDGTPQTVTEMSCTGDRRSEWSKNGRALFSRTELDCQLGPSLVAHTVNLFAGGSSSSAAWVRVELTQSYGRELVESTRYETASVPGSLQPWLPSELLTRAEEARKRTAALPLTVDGVIELSQNVPSRAVEAAIIETDARIPVNRQVVTRLADAAVAPTVIDLVVALAFPKRFVVDRPLARATRAAPPIGLGYASFWGYDDLFWDTRLDFNRDGYFYGRIGILFHGEPRSRDDGDSGAGGGPPPVAIKDARVVKGQGYTQVRPSGALTASGNGAGSGRGGDAGSSGGSGGGSASASPSGYSGGAAAVASESGGGGGRTAVERE